MLNLLITIAPLVLGGCSSLQDLRKTNPDSFYKRTLELQLEAKGLSAVIRGVGVFPAHSPTKIIIRTPVAPELINIRNCHRDLQIENPGKRTEFVYTPSSIEQEGQCPLLVQALDMGKRHEWAYVEFLTNEQLLAIVQCNGGTSHQTGISICQARKELLQQVEFMSPVKWKSNCVVLESDDAKRFRYNMPIGTCQVLFYENSKVIHRHIAIGYEDILLEKL